MKRPLAKRPLALALSALLAALPLPAQSPTPDRGAIALGELVEGLGVSARVLVIGAHPDDEDTRLIAFLSRGRHADVAYLSLTRGDGGQNLIGNELGEALGAVRTEELLAARRVDGARQYFTRAYDFGFSKSAEETFRHWPKDSLLGDVVRVVRSFRPQVIVSVFSGTPRDGHGQHQVAGLLAREAYDAAGDTRRFPVREYGPPWEALKFYRSASFSPETATLRYNAGEFDPLLGRSYAEIAAESRSQHKSQGFGSLQRKGVVYGSVRREAVRTASAPDDATRERSIFDGVDTTWARVRAAASDARTRAAVDSVQAAVAAAQHTPFFREPASLIAPLGRLQQAIAQLPPGSSASAEAARLTERVSALMLAASGVAVEAAAARELVAVGDSVPLTITLYNRGRMPVRALPMRLVGCGAAPVAEGDGAPAEVVPADVVLPDSAHSWQSVIRVARVDRPWWLARGRRGDVFVAPTTDSASVTVRAENDPSRECRASVKVQVDTARPRDGWAVATPPIVYRYADAVKGDVSRPLAGVPAVSVTLDQTVAMLPANTVVDRRIPVTLRSGAAAERTVRVSLALPGGVTADSAARTVTLPAFGTRQVEFRVRGRLPAGHHELRAVAESNGERFTRGYTLVDYDHIRPQRLYHDAVLALEAVDVAIPRGLRVAYIAGVGDNSVPALQQLGVDLTVLEPQRLATADLSRFTTVVVGPRAYEAVPELRAANARLLDWVQRGGTMVVQYGQTEMQQSGVMPYPITLVRPADRVTVEEAPVQLLDPASPLLSTPNRITAADFAGWVQDRTLYMPRTFDEHYQAPLSAHDPGEPPNRGVILATPYGRGMYVYTTLAFFRQLPNGVPGAARLFVNLLSVERRASSALPGHAAPRLDVVPGAKR